MNNIDLFKYCLKNPEPYLDNYYAREKIVLTESKDKVNKLMERNHNLIDLINAYSTLKVDLTDFQKDKIVDDIISLMKKNHMNYTAFAKYFLVHDISYSSFIKSSKKKKREIIIHMLDSYIENRHVKYSSHGYSDIVLQVVSDVHSHKRRGVSGIDKVKNQLKEYDVKHINKIKGEDKNKFYILPDKGDLSIFLKILKDRDIDFTWKKTRQGKNPDVLIMINDYPYIIEHKHMKEDGGGQDKQSSEIIDFIRYGDENASYITYLDGIYFNKLISEDRLETSNYKTDIKISDIEEALESNPQNYFLNTAGFEKFLKLNL